MTAQGFERGNLYLTGFSYTGKSVVGAIVARRLGLRHVDTDNEIVRLAGRPIAEIFASDDESFFRELECEVLGVLSAQTQLVVSTGGGAVLYPANRDTMARSGLVVALEARPETILRRLRESQTLPGATDAVRPLLRGARPLEEIRAIKARRQHYYAQADLTIHTDHFSVEEVADAVVEGVRRLAGRSDGNPDPAAEEQSIDRDLAYTVQTESRSYPIVVGSGILGELGPRLVGLGLAGRAHIITDERVATVAGAAVLESLQRAGISARITAITPGELSKTASEANGLYQWLAEGRAERRDVIVALGGGVVGDLAGFVAASYVRGMGLVQVPTSLLAMVDASVGGKVAIDLPGGKNLVGAFHQPLLVLADVGLLASLLERDLTAGWAEVIKTGLVLDVDLVRYLEVHATDLLGGAQEPLRHVVARSAAIKGRVVSLDERETTGLRARLNYGHTLGHALETAAEYTGLLHGEAVALGMAFASRLAERAGILRREDGERQRALLARFGLPDRLPSGLDSQVVKGALSMDKKVEGGRTRWVLLDAIGHGRLRSDVPPDLGEAVLNEFLESQG